MQITFPTGTVVSIHIVHVDPVNLLNLEVRPSAYDVNNSEGLCGILSNNCTDDFKLRNGSTIHVGSSCHNTENKEFSESWR